jgi:hypothetical protein
LADAFYLPLGGGRFSPTEHTAGPWTPDAQHFGPPSALLVRAFEEIDGGPPRQIARVTVEILGPAPLTELSVRARLERPGRSVELLSAELLAGDRAVARASAWRIATSDTTAVVANAAEALPSPEDVPESAWPDDWRGGYLDAMEWRAVAGDLSKPGPATVWVRQRVALVEGEKPSPLQRLFTVADSGNGVSNLLNPREVVYQHGLDRVHPTRARRRVGRAGRDDLRRPARRRHRYEQAARRDRTAGDRRAGTSCASTLSWWAHRAKIE